jgi:tyrosine-protein kinase Etk/Wzc
MTGMIRVEFSSASPTLAAEVLDTLTAITDRIAVRSLNARATLRREFVQSQLTIAQAALQTAEDSLRQFYNNNRALDAPNLKFEESRLRRQLDLHQETFIALARELQTARIDEVRNLPILRVVDPPVPPARHARPQRTALTLLAFVVGCAVAAGGLMLHAPEDPQAMRPSRP